MCGIGSLLGLVTVWGLSFCIVMVVADDTLNKRANAKWTCTGCRGPLHEQEVFGQIHAAIHKEERIAFLALDFTWLDKVLLPDARVEVTVVPMDELATFIHPTTPLDQRLLNSPSSEDEREKRFSYHIVVSEAPDNIQIERHHHYHQHHQHHQHHRNSKRPSYLDPPSPSVLIFSGVDEMLTHNPCFFPIAEPVLATHGKLGNIGNRRRRLRSDGPVAKQGPRLLILMGFPENMHPTCVLYKSVTKDQFPQKCEYTPAAMSVNELSNIGWAHTVIHLTHSFFDKSMIHGKVVIIPKADAFYSRPVQVTDPLTNITSLSNSGWGWADPATCSPNTYLHDPWACNFLSISNCSDRYRSAHIKPESLTSWSTPSTRLQGDPAPTLTRNRYEGGLRITDATRVAFGDGPKMTEESWAQSRLYAFLQRPNAYLRLLIRVSLRNIGAVGGLSSAVPSLSLSSLLTPCLAMHVRHQDLFLEGHRVVFGIDRSFESHVHHALNLTRHLGLKKIYLATDNATIFDVASSLFPEFTWVFMRRPVPRKMKLFSMFTSMYRSMTENTTQSEMDADAVIPGIGDSKAGVDVQESVTATLSHIIADWRAATYCSAIIAAFDSGFAAQTYRTMCSMSAGGQCPPSYDLRKSKNTS